MATLYIPVDIYVHVYYFMWHKTCTIIKTKPEPDILIFYYYSVLINRDVWLKNSKEITVLLLYNVHAKFYYILYNVCFICLINW